MSNIRVVSWKLSYKTSHSRVPKGLEDVSKYVDLFSALYASGKWSVQVIVVKIPACSGVLTSSNIFLGIKTIGWIKLFKSLERS